MTNFEIYTYLKSKNGGGNTDTATLDALINRSITEINNDRVTNIGVYAFQGCFQLTSVDFPNATSIGVNAFRDCSRLTSADFPNATSIGAHAFRDCSQLSSVNFRSVTSIGDYAFGNCSRLTSVDFPNATSIGAQAFYNCSRLTSIKLASSQVVTLGSANAFERTPFSNGAGSIYVPDELVESYKTATNWVTYANQIKGISGLEET